MKKIEVDEVKRIAFEELCVIDKICRKNNLKYFLMYGTLIGAVRHKGFIPWDDDIDICMPRADFDRFKEIFKEENYRFLTYNDEDYYYSFGKVVDKRTNLKELSFAKQIKDMGVYVDVFPIEALGNGEIKNFKKARRIISTVLDYSHDGPSNKGSIVRKLKVRLRYFYYIKLIGFKKTKQLYYKALEKFDWDQSKCVAIIGSVYNTKDIYPKEWFEETTELEFEGKKFYAPKEYDKVLRKIYGDYMQLPPEEKRVRAHEYDAFYK